MIFIIIIIITEHSISIHPFALENTAMVAWCCSVATDENVFLHFFFPFPFPLLTIIFIGRFWSCNMSDFQSGVCWCLCTVWSTSWHMHDKPHEVCFVGEIKVHVYDNLTYLLWYDWCMRWDVHTTQYPLSVLSLPRGSRPVSSTMRSSLFGPWRLSDCNLRTWSSNILPMLRMEKVKFASSMSQTLDTANATLYARFQISTLHPFGTGHSIVGCWMVKPCIKWCY